MNNRKRYVILALVVAVAGYFVFDYLYKDHRDIQAENSKVEISATELLQKFKNDSQSDLLNSTITVSGIITEIETKSITLDDRVNCSFDGDFGNIRLNEKVSIKGRCIGYDDLFDIVKIDQSSILKE